MAPGTLSSPKSYSIASIPADGIGPEVIEAGITVLKSLAKELQTFDIDFTHYDWDSERYKKTGSYIPEGGLEQLRKHDAIFFGAVGAPGKVNQLAHENRKLTLDKTSLTTFLSGAFALQYASRCSSMPMFARHGS